MVIDQAQKYSAAKANTKKAPKKGRSNANAASSGKPPGHVDCLLSSNVHEITYNISQARTRGIGSLIDHGANGGIAGTDVRLICKSGCKVDITGINNHEVTDLKIGSFGGTTNSNIRPYPLFLHWLHNQ